MSAPPGAPLNGHADGLPTNTKETANISWPVNRPESRGEWTTKLDHDLRLREQATIQKEAGRLGFLISARDVMPGQPRSLSGIASRAFLLGQVWSLSAASALYLAFVKEDPVWRAAFFVATLALFHFLEFWTTARYNTPAAKMAAFLLTNGAAYQFAHSSAMLEHLVTRFFFPEWQATLTKYPFGLIAGLALIVTGQVVRSVAMVQAGTNFNHQVQSKKNEGHVLVTSGLYSWLRHPSYFGFFWWGLGTQLMLGNVVCLAGYAAVLWYFFNSRIQREEKFLVNFFGHDYVVYRRKTMVGIPFIK
ncbi:uncharacterized protein K452DRAFT_267517 [Aplosporella prunicola CBS 121167]|uniref:Protein-S-isoprenylcysteine O-methyltransferase n=1 Tax=Aplosporella prunicola CBS 121167 TaxID=1176127 RepID=A0A6A6BNY1_9PEZI|nr:uncharacterized protein K452DRAFT_267517 [Aplosporella prunicola CBS 121167]KAF2144251.1 hypothetical protein K452DRAFT_267517 [Aplosporella prunicola CBS 121167]